MSLTLAVILLLFSFLVIGVITERLFLPALENIARWLKLSDNIAGATLLAFGSSAPELFTALISMLLVGGRPAFGVGSIIGSALFQVLVVVGFAALVRTTRLAWRPILRDGCVYGLAVLMVYLFARDGVFTRLEGMLFVGSYLVYLAVLILWSRQMPAEPARDTGAVPAQDAAGPIFSRLALLAAPVVFLLKPLPDPRKKPAWTLPVFLLSLVLIGAGAWIFVHSGMGIARSLGVDPTIVALTVIAGGSSIPELFSSAIVARQGRGDMAIANALGSNTFDIFISLGLPVLIATCLYGEIRQVGNANITSSTILLFATLVMVLGLLAAQRFRATRPFGVLLIGCYLVYLLGAYLGWLD